MEKDRYYFQVGLFITIMIFAVIGTIGWFDNKDEQDYYIRYAIYFEGSVNGLSVGSPVKLKGIQVGNVKEIDFASSDGHQIRVIAEIKDTAPIRSDTIATLQMQGITGTSIISLDNDGSEESEYLVRGEHEKYLVIHSRPSSLETLFASIPEVLAEMKHLSAQVSKLIDDDNVKLVNQTLQNIESASKNIDSLFGGKNNKAFGQVLVELNQALVEGKITLREIKMLTRTLREDPSIIIYGQEHEGTKLR